VAAGDGEAVEAKRARSAVGLARATIHCRVIRRQLNAAGRANWRHRGLLYGRLREQAFSAQHSGCGRAQYRGASLPAAVLPSRYVPSAAFACTFAHNDITAEYCWWIW